MSKHVTIFVVDDDPITRFGLKKILARDLDNVSISEFKNGNLAILAFKHLLETNKELPDTLFLDINMPIMDGWEFLESFLKLPINKKMVINILTSSIDPLDSRKFESFKSSCTHRLAFMSKPILRVTMEDILYSGAIH